MTLHEDSWIISWGVFSSYFMNFHEDSLNFTDGCVFPFKYQNIERNECQTTPEGIRWCSTTPDYDFDGQWINCDDDVTTPTPDDKGNPNTRGIQSICI